MTNFDRFYQIHPYELSSWMDEEPDPIEELIDEIEESLELTGNYILTMRDMRIESNRDRARHAIKGHIEKSDPANLVNWKKFLNSCFTGSIVEAFTYIHTAEAALESWRATDEPHLNSFAWAYALWDGEVAQEFEHGYLLEFEDGSLMFAASKADDPVQKEGDDQVWKDRAQYDGDADGTSAENHLNRANVLFDQGSYRLAALEYSSALRLNPDLTEAYYKRGYAKMELKMYPEAISDFNEVIHLDSDNVEAYGNRGVVKNKMGLYSEAIQDFDRVIYQKSDPTLLAKGYYNRGAAKYGLNRVKEGQQDFLKALDLMEDVEDENLKAIILENYDKFKNYKARSME